MENFSQIESDILSKIKNINDRKSYESIKTVIFGKKGIITELFKKIGSLDQSQRKEFASKLNSLKIKVTELLEKKLKNFDQSEINRKLKIDSSKTLLLVRRFTIQKTKGIKNKIQRKYNNNIRLLKSKLKEDEIKVYI